jgi:hypothetical protein
MMKVAQSRFDAFTRKRSLVRTQYRPPSNIKGLGDFVLSLFISLVPYLFQRKKITAPQGLRENFHLRLYHCRHKRCVYRRSASNAQEAPFGFRFGSSLFQFVP